MTDILTCTAAWPGEGTCGSAASWSASHHGAVRFVCDDCRIRFAQRGALFCRTCRATIDCADVAWTQPAPTGGFVVYVTSEARSQARLLDKGRIYPTVEAAAKAIAEQQAMFGSFYRLQVVELVPALAGVST